MRKCNGLLGTDFDAKIFLDESANSYLLRLHYRKAWHRCTNIRHSISFGKQRVVMQSRHKEHDKRGELQR